MELAMINFYKFTSVVLFSSALLACGGSGGGSGSPGNEAQSISVTPSLGKVSQVKIEIYKDDGQTLLGSATIADEGGIVMDVGGYQGPILAKMTALQDATYFDEAVGTNIDLPEGLTLHALSGSVGNLAITPLTELAYQFALVHEAFPLSESSVAMLNSAINTVFAPNVNSILSAPALLGDPAVTSLADDEAGNYALVLAAFALVAEYDVSGQPAIATLNALTQDIADGRIDAQKNGDQIANSPYSSFMFDFNVALGKAASSYDYAGDQNASAVSDLVLVLREPEGGTSTAVACNQTWQLTDGLNYQLVYQLTEGLNGYITTTSSDTTILGGVEFNGEQTFEATSALEVVTSIAPEQVFEVTNLSYQSGTETGEELLVHGFIESKIQEGFTFDTIVSNTPSELLLFNLNRGDSYSQTFEQNQKQQANGIPLQDSTTIVEYEMRYVGRETIIVPAGAFEACKFSISGGPRRVLLSSGAVVEFNDDEANDFWISVDSGLLLRRVVGLNEELLLEATIADQAIKGN
ncbi:MAG: hypothetical protein ACJAW0_000048 [Zhongshania sp.]|jgi:hypothetical protein